MLIKKQKAFTLAEVLVTLGIIGVIAALTISTLVENSQKKETVVRLQKIYSTITQAVQMSEIENGPMTGWDPPTLNYDDAQSAVWWNTYFTPYSTLSVVKTCTWTNAYDCWASNSTYLDGSAVASPGFLTQVLQDGCVVTYQKVSDTGEAQIFVDLNGKQKPNRMGRDIFYILIQSKKGFVGLAYKGASRAALLQNNTGDCTKTSIGAAGSYCGGLIQIDGWKISADYPWN